MYACLSWKVWNIAEMVEYLVWSDKWVNYKNHQYVTGGNTIASLSLESYIRSYIGLWVYFIYFVLVQRSTLVNYKIVILTTSILLAGIQNQSNTYWTHCIHCVHNFLVTTCVYKSPWITSQMTVFQQMNKPAEQLLDYLPEEFVSELRKDSSRNVVWFSFGLW